MSKILKINLISVSFIVFGTVGIFDFTNASVISNVGTGKSCSTLCSEQNINQRCTNTGTDPAAVNLCRTQYSNGVARVTNCETYWTAACSSRTTIGYRDRYGNDASGPVSGGYSVYVGFNCQCTPSPSAPTISLATPGNSQITLNWLASADGGGLAIAGYNIYRSITAGGELPVDVFAQYDNSGIPASYNSGIVIGNTTSYTDVGLTNGTRYYYKIAARNSAGTIGKQQSNEVSAVPIIRSCSGSDANSCSSWGACINGNQTCTGMYTKTPSGCTGSVSAPIQSCTSLCEASSYTYSDYSPSTCPASGQQTRTYTKKSNCSGGAEPVDLVRNCTLECSGVDVNTCTYLGSCVNGSQTCTPLKTPIGCTGGGSLLDTPIFKSCTLPQSSTVTYGVYADNTTGELSGYAWSDNIGWIKFGGLPAFPSGSGTYSGNAKLSNNKLIGWARACAGTADGKCTSMTSRTDGWDGWISLSGSALDGSKYGVSLSGTDFSGYAWGADVIGWIDFTGVKLSAAPISNVSVTLTVASSSISKNTSTTFSWSSVGASSCTFKKGEAVFNVGSTATSGSSVSTEILDATATFFVTCTNSDHTATGTDSKTVNIITPPACSAGACTTWGDWTCVNKTNSRTCKTYPKIPSNCVGSVSAPTESTGSCGGQTGNEDECANPANCEFIWKDTECTPIESETTNLTLSCVNPDPEVPSGPDNPKIVVIHPTKISNCIPSQIPGDINIYKDMLMTWTMKNDLGNIGRVKWTIKDVSTTTEVTPGGALKFTYTSNGKKNMTALTVVTRLADDSTFISACSTTTKITAGTGVTTEE